MMDNDAIRKEVRAIMDDIFRLKLDMDEDYLVEPEDMEAAAIVHRIISRLERGPY